MAQNNEEIIILEEAEKQEPQLEPKEIEDKSKEKKKKLIIFGSIIAALFVLILVLVIIFFSSQEEGQKEPAIQDITKKFLEPKKSELKKSELEEMIAKANLFYLKGNKKEALKLFEKISMYSDAISNYNLGVAQMQEGAYEEALKSFQKAIDIGEDRSFSAINAAVCALKLNKRELFKYYIDLAKVYLPTDGDTPLYSYLHALVNYYSDNYFEAFSPLVNKSSEFYESETNHLLSRLYLLYDDNYKAISALEKNPTTDDFLPLGQLFARIGEYDIALNYIIRYIQEKGDSLDALMSKALVEIKKGSLKNAAATLDAILTKYKDDATNTYQIGVKLKDTLFDINLAQKDFKDQFGISKKSAYKIIFYYSPYKVFDANAVLSYIKKGSLEVFINEVAEGKELLKRGSTISKVNLNIAKAIAVALDHRVRDANTLLKEVVDAHPNHSILHYNLALSYAHLGEFDVAYKHFLRSYHLDNRNLLAGVYAMMCAEMINKEADRLRDSITEDLDHFEGNEDEKQYILALLAFIQGNAASALEWFEKDKKKTPLYLALDAMIAHKTNHKDYIKKAKELKEIQKGDIIAEMFWLIANNRNNDVKEFSLKAQEFFKDKELNLDSLYYGSEVVRELYIKLAYITGTIHIVKDSLKERLLVERSDSRGILQALAFASIYAKEFEESYSMYNKLIDEFKIKDTNTLFFGSVAAIASNHHASAIALLELSKLTDPTNREARYALGLLYQEAKNLKAASIQYGAIGNVDFKSEYFDFDIVSIAN